MLDGTKTTSPRRAAIRTFLVLPAAAALIALYGAACSHDITVRNLEDGSQIRAVLQLAQRDITLLLPDGEVAAGSVAMLTTQSIGEGSLFFGSNPGELLGRNVGAERLHGYVQAVGDRGTRLEAVLSIGWLGHGFGVARTGDGRQFQVAF